MFDLIFESQNLPFSVSLALMLAMALLEGVGTILGAGISGFLDSIVPDFDFDIDIDMDVDVDMDIDAPDIDAPSGVTRFLGWLRIGQVPVLMLLIIFLTLFGLVGLGMQSFMQGMTGHFLPASIAVVPAFFISLPGVRIFGGILGKIMPQDETYAVSEKEFIGRVAYITLGKATKGNPTRAKLKDRHGTVHYIMVEPDEEEVVFLTGQSVILVSQNGAVFKAIENRKDVLKN